MHEMYTMHGMYNIYIYMYIFEYPYIYIFINKYYIYVHGVYTLYNVSNI